MKLDLDSEDYGKIIIDDSTEIIDLAMDIIKDSDTHVFNMYLKDKSCTH